MPRSRSTTNACQCLAAVAAAILATCKLAAGQEAASRIVDIGVSGNLLLHDQQIIAESGLKIGDQATKQALEAARTRLYASGWFGAAMRTRSDDTIRLISSPVSGGLRVTIAVVENGVVKALNLTGTGPIMPKDVLVRLKTKRGEMLNLNALRADIKTIQAFYDSKGFIASVDDDGFGIVNGILNIPVVVAKIRKVEIVGADNKLLDEARRILAIEPGTYYNINVFRVAYTRLYNTEKFQDIRPSITLPARGVADMKITLVPK